MNTYSVIWLNREVAKVFADRVIADNRQMDFYIGNNIVASFDRKFATSIRCHGERKEQG